MRIARVGFALLVASSGCISGCSSLSSPQSGGLAVDLRGANCSADVPPAEAVGRRLTHGALFVHPLDLPVGYSGCHSVWASSGSSILWRKTVWYVRGTPTAYVSQERDPTRIRQTICTYEVGGAVRKVDTEGGAERVCPDATTFLVPGA